MEINKDRLWKLLDDVAEGKYRKLARLMDVQVSQLHKVLNKDSKAGPVFLGKLRKFCKDNGLNFDEFVLDESS
jgi:hypothetical protein